MAAGRILLLLSVVLHQSFAPPSSRQPLNEEVVKPPPFEVQLDSGFTNTGELYLTGGPLLTHATYQNLDINRRKVNRQLHPKYFKEMLRAQSRRNAMKDATKEARYHAGYGNVVINESLWKKLPEFMPYGHMMARQRFPTTIVSNKYSQKFNAFSF